MNLRRGSCSVVCVPFWPVPIAKHLGPGVGGLFLAFPAIFPAGCELDREPRETTQGADSLRWNGRTDSDRERRWDMRT